MKTSSIYDFKALSIEGKDIDFNQFKGQVLLIVNTASACGFTPQLKELQQLHQAFGAQGLRVIGFPCNQFGGQEPKGSEEIAQFCAQNYGVEFMLMQKIDVNGEQAHPLFSWLKSQAPGLLSTEGIKWNFTKFLVGKAGDVVCRYAPQTSPLSIKADIELALGLSQS
jgi:glutathione peroxidase